MRYRLTILLAGLLAVGGAASAANHDVLARGTLLAADGSVVGQVQLSARTAGVELKLTVKGLPAGVHGVHLHAVGSCNAPDFASAGAHLNPGGKMHGTMNPMGSHLGDLPNLTVGGGGKGALSATIAGAPAELNPLLFDADGVALVVHDGTDDYRTDPSGNSGGRIACAVLTRIR